MTFGYPQSSMPQVARAPMADPVLSQFATEHLRYEIVTLAEIAASYPTTWSKQRFERCGLESLLVHVRLIDEFLGFELPSAGSRSEKDVRALDYLPTWSRSHPLTKQEREDIGAYVAHLSTKRVTGKMWKPVELAFRTLSHFDRFVAAVTQSPTSAYREAWLRWPEVSAFLNSSPPLQQPGGGY